MMALDGYLRSDRIEREPGHGKHRNPIARAGKPQATTRLRPLAIFLYVFLPFAFGHYLSLLLRNVNAVLAPDLTASLALGPAQLGLLTSAFFLSYALLQLPIGLALDRFGPRRVQAGLMAVATTGALLFAHCHSFGQLVAARALLGVGLAGCFMSAVKAISTCVTPGKLPSVNGYLLAVGGLGSASATLPVRWVLRYTDWRGLFTMLAALTACAGLLVWLLAPAHVRGAARPRGAAARQVLEVYRHPSFRKTVSLVLVPHAVFFGVQGLWLGRWLSDVASFSDTAVAQALYASMAAVIVGAVAVGLVTEWAGRHGIAPLDLAAAGVATFVLVQVVAMFNYAPSLQMLVVLFTLVGSITGIEYTIVAQSMPRELTGRASTCLNLLVFIGAFLVQAGFGQVLGAWGPGPSGHYPAPAYRAALGLLVLCQLPGLVFYLRARRPERRKARSSVPAHARAAIPFHAGPQPACADLFEFGASRFVEVAAVPSATIWSLGHAEGIAVERNSYRQFAGQAASQPELQSEELAT